MTGGKPAGRVSFHVISSTTEKLAFNAALILLLKGQSLVLFLFCINLALIFHFHIHPFETLPIIAVFYYFLGGNSAVHRLGGNFFFPKRVIKKSSILFNFFMTHLQDQHWGFVFFSFLFANTPVSQGLIKWLLCSASSILALWV